MSAETEGPTVAAAEWGMCVLDEPTGNMAGSRPSRMKHGALSMTRASLMGGPRSSVEPELYRACVVQGTRASSSTVPCMSDCTEKG